MSRNYIIILFNKRASAYPYLLGIFDMDMNLVRSFEITDPYKELGIVVHGKNIVLIPDGCEYATEISYKGEFVHLYEFIEDDYFTIYDTTMNNTRKFGEYKYYITNNKNKVPKEGGYTDKAFLIKEDASGNKTVLYDASKHHRLRAIALVFAIIMMIITIASGIFYKMTKETPYTDNRKKSELISKLYKYLEYIYEGKF